MCGVCRKKQKEGDTRDAQEIAVEYNDKVIYPDKVRINRCYLHHYSFAKDWQMILLEIIWMVSFDSTCNLLSAMVADKALVDRFLVHR